MPTSCQHLDIGCCDDCHRTWIAARAVMQREQRAFDHPGRDIPHDRNFPDSDAWIDDDGVVHQDG